MKRHGTVCGPVTLRLDKEEECPECAQKEEMRSRTTKSRIIAPR
jgi:hypothetical protein